MFLTSHPAFNNALIVLSAFGFFGVGLVDFAVQVSYCAEIAKTIQAADREKKIDSLKTTRLVLQIFCLICGYALFSLIITSSGVK